MQRVWNTQFARLVDELSIKKFGVPEQNLMRNAAQKVADAVNLHLRDDVTVVCLAGRGNNGGDALYSLLYLPIPESRLRVYTFFEAGELSLGCQAALLALQEKYPNLPIIPYQPGGFQALAEQPVVIIDGVFGLGFHPPMVNLVQQAFDELYSLRRKVIAVDIASGLVADSFDVGQELASAAADHSISFGGLKPAQVVSPARSQSTTVAAVDIGFAPEAMQAATALDPGKLFLFELKDAVEDPWRHLPAHAHKFDRGHTLVIGGSAGKVGAPVMTAMAALRAGGGWSSVALPYDSESNFPALPLELTFETFFKNQQIDSAALKEFVEKRHVSAIVIGPGTVQQPLDTSSLELLCTWSRAGINIILDAAATKDIVPRLQACAIKPVAKHFLLTPHPGEWLQLPLSRPQAYDDLPALLAQAADLGVTLIHKGATPLVFSGKRAVVHTENSNALARAGSGDIFAGLSAGYTKCFDDVVDCAHQAFVALFHAVEFLSEFRDAHSLWATDILRAVGCKRDWRNSD